MGTRYGPVQLRVPKGFPVLLQRFAREVLREQPSDVSKFGADYFKALLDHRNSTAEDPLKADPLDELGFHVKPKKVLRPVSSEVRQKEIQQDIAAAKIQARYRGYHVRKQYRQKRDQTSKLQREAAATRIQAQYRGHRTRKNLKTLHEKIPEIAGTEEEDQEERQVQQRYSEDENYAAIRIQANFRGYQARKLLKPENNQVDSAAVTEAPKDVNEEMTGAAVKIQASYRGHRTRNHLKQTRNVDSAAVTEAPKDVNEEMTGAAVKIQASYRGHRTRKHLKQTRNYENPGETDVLPDKEQGKPDLDETVEGAQETENEDQLEEADLYDPKIQAAALKIQASYRGHRTRKQLKENIKESHQEAPQATGGGDADASETKPDLSDQREDGDLNDPEIQAAALKIQASYRGHRTRKQLKENIKELHQDAPQATGGGDADASETKFDLLSEPEQHVEQILEAPEENDAAAGDMGPVPEKEDKGEEVAAIKIQAQYRGYRTRKLLKSNKGAEDTPPTVADVQDEKQDSAEPKD